MVVLTGSIGRLERVPRSMRYDAVYIERRRDKFKWRNEVKMADLKMPLQLAALSSLKLLRTRKRQNDVLAAGRFASDLVSSEQGGH